MPTKSSNPYEFRKLPEIVKNPSDFNRKNMAYLGRTCFALYNEPTDTKFIIASMTKNMQVEVYALVDLDNSVYVIANDFVNNYKSRYEFLAYDICFMTAFCSKLNLDVHFKVPYGHWKTINRDLCHYELVNDGRVSTDDGTYFEGHIEAVNSGEKLSSVKDVIYHLNETDSWVKFAARPSGCALYDSYYSRKNIIIWAHITRARVEKNPSKNIEKVYYAKCINIDRFDIPYNGLGYNKDFIKIFVEKCANTEYELIKLRDDDPLMSEFMRVGCTFEKKRKQNGVSYTFLRIPKANA